LWGSKDGASWQLLLDCPAPPSGVLTQLYYNQDVPGLLLGSTSFWLQTRMQETGGLTDAPDPAADWSQAQFSRLNPGNPGNVFQLNVTEVPEPGTWQVGLGGLMALAWLRRRR
jgi:MYXO-CTERM domain-containing protein